MTTPATTPNPTEQAFTLRLSAPMMDLLQKAGDRLEKERGVKVPRAMVVRELLHVALWDHETGITSHPDFEHIRRDMRAKYDARKREEEAYAQKQVAEACAQKQAMTSKPASTRSRSRKRA